MGEKGLTISPDGKGCSAWLASIIGMMDLTKAAQTVSQREIRPFEMYLVIGVAYRICTYGMSRLSRWLEGKMSPEQMLLTSLQRVSP